MRRNNLKPKQTNIHLGCYFSELLTILFMVLKLCNVIDWSWWWVLSPLWISFGLAVILLLGVILLAYWLGREK